MTSDQLHAQRMDSLQKGNEVRFYRAAVKADVRSGAMDPRMPIATRDPGLDGLPLMEYLRSVPGLGPQKVKQMLARCDITAQATLGELKARQRTWLMMWLRDHVEQSKRWKDARAAFEESIA